MNVGKDRKERENSEGCFSCSADCEWLADFRRPSLVLSGGMDAAAAVGARVVVCFATAYPTLLMMMMLELELAAWRKLNTGSVKHKFLRPCGVFRSFVLIGLVVNFKRKANFGLGMIFIFILRL